MARTSIAQTSLTSSQIDGKLPPQAKEIEQIILGACLIESDAFEKIASELSEADFYDKRNQSVFKAISGLYKERKPIDMMTVTQAMLSSGDLESIGGPIYIASLTSKIGSSAHILDHAMIVKERSIQRKGLVIANELENAIYSNLCNYDLYNPINIYKVEDKGKGKGIDIEQEIKDLKLSLGKLRASLGARIIIKIIIIYPLPPNRGAPSLPFRTRAITQKR